MLDVNTGITKLSLIPLRRTVDITMDSVKGYSIEPVFMEVGGNCGEYTVDGLQYLLSLKQRCKYIAVVHSEGEKQAWEAQVKPYVDTNIHCSSFIAVSGNIEEPLKINWLYLNEENNLDLFKEDLRHWAPHVQMGGYILFTTRAELKNKKEHREVFASLRNFLCVDQSNSQQVYVRVKW